jgi:hypothetical protein
MSALGQERTCAVQNGMSALPPKADIRRAKISRPEGHENEIIWRLVAKLIRFDRYLVVARFRKTRQINCFST